MKIGIITIHKSPNYGACLQSYALFKYLEQQGYEVEIIDLHRPYQIDYVESKRYVPYSQKKRTIKVRIKEFLCRPFKRWSNKKIYLSKQSKVKFDSFNAQLNYSRPYYGIDDLYENPPVYDVYITGSDQVWNPSQPYCIEPYFLTFASGGVKKISYASSLGVKSLLPNEKKDFKRWLSLYDAISVREQSGVNLLSDLVDKTVEQISDPTFLLSYEEWCHYKSPITIKGKYILLFTLSYFPNLAEYVKHLSKESGLPMVYLCLGHPNNAQCDYTIVSDAGPGEFLSYIEGAEMLITDSFHGTVFAMHMHTHNFFTYIGKNNKRGSRITDMFSKFGLSEHLLDVEMKQSYDKLNSIVVDHNVLSALIESERIRCQDFLKRNLSAES